MKNSLTKHAIIRLRQRGIREEVMFYLQKYGETSFAHRGAMKVSLNRRDKNKLVGDLKKAIRRIERSGDVIIIEKNGRVLTGYHKK